jgi:hypothetical protein
LIHESKIIKSNRIKPESNLNQFDLTESFAEHYPHPSLIQFQFQSEVQVQETSLKKKRKGTFSNIPKSKKIPFLTLQLTQV